MTTITLADDQKAALLRWLRSSEGLGAVGYRWEWREVLNGIYQQLTGEDHPIMSHPQRTVYEAQKVTTR